MDHQRGPSPRRGKAKPVIPKVDPSPARLSSAVAPVKYTSSPKQKDYVLCQDARGPIGCMVFPCVELFAGTGPRNCRIDLGTITITNLSTCQLALAASLDSRIE
ncbi:Homoaconitase [Fusarium oxysporum f. sp. albedinis]|nr:Homoaconitase [Fusarium oxysporum f. sp. albedinis]